MRQIPNFRYTARGRPQIRHRRTARVENFGFRSAAAIFDLLAICPSGPPNQLGPRRYAARNGIPNFRNNSRASSFFVALVTNVTFIPCVWVNLSGFNSGKTNCSVSPKV